MDGWVDEWVEEKKRDLYILGSMSKLWECGLEMSYLAYGCLGRLDLKPSLKFKGWSLE